ncbi:MAG TPA: Lrp/AsnC family transcriptional regulator [Aggregatilineales bacterium]|nr:Lrp/AsnC family transcriptional regulator [Aggregatilineales bacterium]
MIAITEETEKLLDSVGWQILRELQENARIPFSELGRRVGLSSPAVTERVRRMEDAGIISGYHVTLNLGAVGLPMQAILRIRSYAGRSPQVAAQVSEMPEILECYKVTGVDCYIMKVAVQSVEHLESIIDTLAHCGDVTTSLVLSTPVERRIIG